MDEQRSDSLPDGLTEWNPQQQLRSVEPLVARYSRGFLRSRPERWFPGLGTQWMPLAHSLGLQVDVIEVKPVMTPPLGSVASFVGSVDDEPLGIYVEEDSLVPLLESVVPGSGQAAGRIVTEYLCRRLLASLAMSWSGPESTVVRFETEMSADAVRPIGGIKLGINVNGVPITLWLGLGKLLLDRLDGLWRRQLQSTGRREEGDSDVSSVKLEIASLAVPPSRLSDYTRPGEVIDLEVPLSDQVLLCSGGGGLAPARLCVVGSHFGLEALPVAAGRTRVPAGTTRLSVELGEYFLEGASVGEIVQDGAVVETSIPVSSSARLAIDGQEVGRGTLYVFEGRFALAVS